MSMRVIEIAGGRPLCGKITIQGSKNAVLPILASCLMGEGACRIENCPCIRDVSVTLRLLERCGCRVEQQGNTVWVESGADCGGVIPDKEASQIRSSVLFLGALLGRCHHAVLPLPGGCAIGARPIDLHQKALEMMGVTFENREGSLSADGKGLHGAPVHLTYPSVGATENIILAAVLAPGRTEITGAAREPEVAELCHFLNLRGARIQNDRKGSIRIDGVEQLKPVCYRMQADRIVAGTYLIAAAATQGQITIDNFPAGELELPLALLRQTGVQAEICKSSCKTSCCSRPRAISCLETAPYPGFPTDLQSPMLALLSVADGESCVRETVFENRFCVAEELKKMGADVRVRGDCAVVRGKSQLRGAAVHAPDLRSGAALVVAGLFASGLTRINHIGYIERGYEDICRDLRQLGAQISLKNENEK
jgi:UDP-N-acetylglucosamine 1-carboxyvinyltransferase